MWIVRYVECIGFELLELASFGEAKSKRSLLGPGWR